MEITPIIEQTADGSPTLRHPLSGEAYHSLNGAVTESKHVFIRAGFETCGRNHVRVLEAGFGSGLNALLTLLAAESSGKSVYYTAVELYPVSMRTVAALSYSQDRHFVRLHEAEWGVPTTITDNFTLHKIEADLAKIQFDTTFDVVYFDAFAPDCQPELWTTAIFTSIFDALATGGVLVTYSAKGEVKQALRKAGFEVSRLGGAPGKRHMLRAIKIVNSE